MNPPNSFMLFTSDLASDTDTLNARKRQLLERQLQARGLDWRKVQGSYKGTPEHSYMVQTPDTKAEHEVLVLAWRYAQESVLYVSPNGYASLWYVAGDNAAIPGEVERVEPVGFWREFDPSADNILPESYTIVRFGTEARTAYFTTVALP